MSSAPPAEELDQELLALVNQAGRKGWTDAAFGPVYRRYHPHFLSYFRRRVDRVEVAKELAQDTMMNVFKSPGTFDSLPRFEAWMTTVARNVLKNHWRSGATGKRQGMDVPLDELEGDRGEKPKRPSPGKPPEPVLLAAMVQSEERVKVAKALLELPSGMRNVAVLRFEQDRGYEEIARILGVSINTVKSQLHEAKKRLRQLLGEPPED